MANYALLTAHGKDRPGIVAALARVLLDSDCNIEDSQMARLGPDFACMLAVRMPEGLLSEQLHYRLAQIASELNLAVRVHDLRPEEAGDMTAEQPRHLIQVHGADRKGIVHRISEHLAARAVNITNLHTQVVRQQPPLYVMTIEAELPPFVDAGQLESELSDIGRTIDVSVAVRPGSQIQST